MPKTSASQFELMVDFMERYGDLSKPTEGPGGRLNNIRHWVEISDILNADATGDTKTADKWRKVWSDLKNNTKRKAARINRAVSGTGGGPALNIRLTELEKRVLNIIGTQAATGIVEVMEIGLYQENIPEEIRQATPPIPADQHASEPALHTNTQPGSSVQSVGEVTIEPANIEFSMPLPEATPTESHPQPVRVSPRRRQRSVTHLESPAPTHPLAESVQVTPRRRRRLLRTATSPLLRARPATQSEVSRQVFLNCDREWRNFLRDRESEQVRLREIELQQQARWQDLFQQFLLTLNQAIDLLNKKIQ